MDLLAIATAAARAAGALLLDRFGAPRTGVSSKSSATDMVSDADRAAERLIIDTIRASRPADGFLAEESGDAAGTSGYTWIVDPLDGTTNFLFGIPQWAVSIACARAGETLAGVVYDAVRDELFAAARGEGAMLNGESIRVSAATELSRALVATGFSYDPAERVAAARLLSSIIGSVRDVRRAGAAALDLAWVACGRADAYYEAPIFPWDVAAGTLLVTEAGGRVGPMEALGESGPGMIAAGPEIFDDLERLVRESRASGRRDYDSQP